MHIKEPSINLLSVLILLGAAQGIFFSIVLAGMKTGNRVANRFLVSLLLVFSAGLADGFMSVTYYYVRYPALIGIAWPLTFAYGPLLYFYVKSLTMPGWRIQRWKLSPHFIPVLLFSVYLIPTFLMEPQTKARLWHLENSTYKNYSLIIDPVLFLVVIQLVVYIILSLRLLKRHSAALRRNFSSIENISLSWLRNLMFIFLCLLSMFIFLNFLSQFIGIYPETQYSEYLLEAAIIYVMGYRGMRQPEIFAAGRSGHPEADIAAASDASKGPGFVPEPSGGETEKYRKSSLSPVESEKILARLLTLMEKERPYRDTALALPRLADILNVSSHHLSQVVNEKLNKSFFDFVNEYRVRETQMVLCSPESDRFSILGIAMDAGFNSKSAFYSAFKKHTGMTPTQFKKRHSLSGPSPADASNPIVRSVPK